MRETNGGYTKLGTYEKQKNYLVKEKDRLTLIRFRIFNPLKRKREKVKEIE